MADHNKSGTERKDLFSEPDRLEIGMREQLRTWIEQIVQEESTSVLGAGSSPRGRQPARVSPRDAGADADHEPGADDAHAAAPGCSPSAT